MMFSTKAEYGVRVMVELARRGGSDAGGLDAAAGPAGVTPVPLAEIAAGDGLPLAYLEHLVARLRKAGLVDSRRGPRRRSRWPRWSRPSRARSRRSSASRSRPTARSCAPASPSAITYAPP